MKTVKKLFKNELFAIISGAVLFAAALIFDVFEISVAALVLYILALVFAGHDVFYGAVRGIFRGDLLDERFLMCIASVGAMIISEYREGVAVMLFYLVGEYFQHRAVRKSRDTIKSLMSICPDEAVRIEDGEEVSVYADDLECGDIIVIRSGERVPADAVVTGGSAYVDTSALTGESVPFSLAEGDTVRSGSIIVGGAVKAKVLHPADESSAQRILELVENATERKSREENFITEFSHYYTPIIVGLAFVMAIVPSLLGWTEWSESIYRALSFLVISCPCALVISVPMAFFGGIGAAASVGILFKGGNRFGSVASAKTVAFDKTGTLTTGSLVISEIKSFGMPKEKILTLAASCEYASNHPISKCIKASAQETLPAEDFRELAGMGSVASVEGTRVAVGNSKLMKKLGIPYSAKSESAGEVLVAVGDSLEGIICLSDAVKPEVRAAIEELYRLGVKNTVILSGDKKKSVERVLSETGIKDYRAELMPEEKFSALEELIASGDRVMYVGDGINDAPALTLADVGIAMGGVGSDQAIEAADVVIMSDNLEKLPTAVRIARKTVAIAKENIVFALGIKLAVLVLTALGFANMWHAVFADVGVAVIAILNAMRALTVRK